MNGSDGLIGQSPSAACRSVWHTPQATTLTNTLSSATSGTSTSWMDNGWPNSRTTAACIIVLAIADSFQRLLSARGNRPAACTHNRWIGARFPSAAETMRAAPLIGARSPARRGRAAGNDGHVADQVDNLARIAPLVVVPSDEFHEAIIQ